MRLFETPEEVRSRVRQRSTQGVRGIGGLFGYAIGNAMGGGIDQNPEVQRANKIQSIVQTYASQNKDKPPQEQILGISQALMRAGEVDIATGLMNKVRSSEGQARKPIQTTTGWVDPNTGDYMTDPQGNTLMPISASPTLKREMMRASGEGQGISKVVTSAYEGIDNITQNIADLKEARRLVVEEGADTGPLVSKMPTLRSASRKLKTIQSKLGLNVVGSVTFGALSKGELDLALSTALPTELDGPELVDWIDRKIVAQEKLSENLGLAADYLSVPGNTRAGWRKEVKKMKKGPPKGIDAEDWKYMTPEEKALW